MGYLKFLKMIQPHIWPRSNAVCCGVQFVTSDFEQSYNEWTQANLKTNFSI